MKGKKLTTSEFIKRAIEKHGNLYDYRNCNYINAKTKICIIHPKYGEHWLYPHCHLKGSGHPIVGRKSSIKNQSSTTSEFIKKANKIHNNFYDYSKTDYINSHTKVIVIDPVYGEYTVYPNDHLKSSNKGGHPQRAKDKAIKQLSARKTDQDVIIKRFKDVHGNLYDYSKVNYINYSTKVLIIHPIYGEHWITPINHINNKQGHPLAKNKNRTSYNPNKPGYFYINEIIYNNKIYYKFGITSNYNVRLKRHQSKNKLCSTEKYKLYYCNDGMFIKCMESYIKQYSNIKTKALDKDIYKEGYTETINESELLRIISIINSFIDLHLCGVYITEI
ncbi:hypothetical protein DIDNDMLP_00247 [Klebsiella phage KP13-7]|nr:hypothetical protein DIDNDMLP_00247 [Klebsiella phage KP13-7]